MSGRNQRGGSSQRQYRGIRMRRWGKWVSEIGEPSTRTRIWLGSFRTAEEAAHAYDAALVCIGGPNAQLNFPNDPPTIPRGTPGRYTTREIQAAAAASAAASVGRPFSYSDFMSPKASDSHDGQDLEDITYTEPAQAAQPAPSNSTQSYDSCSNAGQFDDPYERECVNNMICPPDPKDIMSGRNQRGESSQRQYRGIRMRRWGKWVSEIGEPSTRTRIWLGSFRTAEEAAHAYDAALVCIGGPNAQLNFPNDPPTIPRGTPGRYTTREIQAAAAASAAASVGRPFSYSDFMSPKASDSHDGQDLEDITYTEPAQAAQPAPSNSTQSYDSCSNAGQFDDPYERECVNNMICPPHPKDDSDDDNDSFVEPSLWSYR